MREDHSVSRRTTVVVFLATIGQLAVATAFPDLPQFDGKAFGARLVFYPLLMLVVPACWLLATRRRDPRPPAPWGAFTLLMLPFLIDVTGNTLDLYDRVTWWDDANHFVNWCLLCTGIGLLVGTAVRPRWALALLVAGVGALLAILWELGEYLTFIRGGTELDTAYQDTLGDLVLGTAGAVLAGAIVSLRRPGPNRSTG
jgi:hypothetical protein